MQLTERNRQENLKTLNDLKEEEKKNIPALSLEVQELRVTQHLQKAMRIFEMNSQKEGRRKIAGVKNTEEIKRRN